MLFTTNSLVRRFAFMPSAGLYSFLLIGCVSTPNYTVDVAPAEMRQFLSDKPAEAANYYRNILLEGERNAALNYMRTSLVAFQLGDYALAGRDLDQVLNRVNSFNADEAAATASHSSFQRESTKDFLGEPYERALANYYRGILYLAENDYRMAMSSFKQAQAHDAVVVNQQYATDMTSAELLAGWAAHCELKTDPSVTEFARISDDHFQRAMDIRNQVSIPLDSDNLLVVLETGGAPIKMASPDNPELLSYTRGNEQPPLGVLVNDQEVAVMLAEDVYRQAFTRGDRNADDINARKAVVQGKLQAASETANDIGDVGGALSVGLMEWQQQTGVYSEELMDASAGMLGLWALGKAIGGVASNRADAVQKSADTRYWDNLPDKIYIGFGQRARDQATPIEFTNNQGQIIHRTFFNASSDTCDILHVRTSDPTQIPVIQENARK